MLILHVWLLSETSDRSILRSLALKIPISLIKNEVWYVMFYVVHRFPKCKKLWAVSSNSSVTCNLASKEEYECYRNKSPKLFRKKVLWYVMSWLIYQFKLCKNLDMCCLFCFVDWILCRLYIKMNLFVLPKKGSTNFL